MRWVLDWEKPTVEVTELHWGVLSVSRKEIRSELLSELHLVKLSDSSSVTRWVLSKDWRRGSNSEVKSERLWAYSKGVR